MEVTLRATEFKPDEPLKSYAAKKVAKLERYLPDLDRAEVELSLEPTRGVEARRIVQINLIQNGKVLLRVERRAADPHAAVDAAVDTLKEQLLRYKEVRQDWRHNRLFRRDLEREKEGVKEIEEVGAEEEGGE